MTFAMHRQERVWFSCPLTLTNGAGTSVTVAPTAWEASFDGGTTWNAAVEHPDIPGRPAWLLCGPAFPGPGDNSADVAGQVVVTTSTLPMVRLIDSPETTITETERLLLI